MDTEIRKHLEDVEGNVVLGVYSFECSNKTLHLLFDPTVLLAVITLQKVRDRVYIESVDTTGCRNGYTRSFIVAVLRSINHTIACCFSRPKDEYVFGRSSLNKKKNVLDARELLEYWIAIFDEIYERVYVWSNYYENKSYPFESIEDLICFEDDPKARLMRHFEGSLEEMFWTLLCRTDFRNGSLVYGGSICGVESKSYNFKAREMDILKIRELLKSLDFSTYEKSVTSTKKFISIMKIEVEYFKAKEKVKRTTSAHPHVLHIRKK